jgi:hypothetical protein
MTQRSIQAGPAATVIVRAGGTVRVVGHKGERVLASTESRWGLKVKRRGDTVDVHIGGSGEVQVPLDCSVKIYAGANVALHDIGGSATIYAGGQCVLRGVGALAYASAGAALDIECERIEGDALLCSAGRDLRFYIHDLPDAKLAINDLGGYWEGMIGTGCVRVRLTAGGDVILVTDQTVVAQPPHYLLGRIERPGERRQVS